MFRVGDEVSVRYDGSRILGRVLGLAGGILFIVTPHGSEITAGFSWVRSCSKLEHEQLLAYEAFSLTRSVFYDQYLDYQI